MTESRQCLANVRVEVFDFGPDCKIVVDDKDVIKISDYVKDGVIVPIEFKYSFSTILSSRATASTDMKLEIYREWKEEDRLVFTRIIQVKEGNNDLNLTFYGIKDSKRISSGLFRKRVEQQSGSDNKTNPIA